MAPISGDWLQRPGLLAALCVGILTSCAPEPGPVEASELNAAMSDSVNEQGEEPRSKAEDVCAIYHSMFPASVIGPLESIYDDPRVSTRTEAGSATRADVQEIRGAIIESTGGASSQWADVSEDLLVRAFRSWRAGPLPDCDWMGFAREVSAPARNGQIAPVLVDEKSGSYVRVSRPYFIDRDRAIALVRDVFDDGRMERKLVFTYRDGDGWAMQSVTFEETVREAE